MSIVCSGFTDTDNNSVLQLWCVCHLEYTAAT